MYVYVSLYRISFTFVPSRNERIRKHDFTGAARLEARAFRMEITPDTRSNELHGERKRVPEAEKIAREISRFREDTRRITQWTIEIHIRAR